MSAFKCGDSLASFFLFSFRLPCMSLYLLSALPPPPRFCYSILVKYNTYHNKGDERGGAEHTGGDLGKEGAQHDGRGGLALPVGAVLHHLHGAACRGES